MEQRRFVLFLTLSMAFMVLWFNVAVPVLFPPPPKAPLAETASPPDDEFYPPVSALQPENVRPVAAGVPAHPAQKISLGSLDPNSPYFLQVNLTTEGAAVESIVLNDPRYPQFRNPQGRVHVVGADPDSSLRTLELSVPELDLQFGGTASLQHLDWEVVPDSLTPASVAFRIRSADGRYELTKRYSVRALTAEEQQDRTIRDRLAEGYDLSLTVEIRNLSVQPGSLVYVLQGPVGTPLEDAANSTKFRDVQLGFLNADGTGVTASHMAVPTVLAKEDAQKPEIWTRPLKYIGVDVRYFAALLRPLEDQLKTPTIETSQAELVTRDPLAPVQSDVSVRLTSAQLKLEPQGTTGDTIQHHYALFAGPKRQRLLEAISAEGMIFGPYGRDPSSFFNGMAELFTFLWRMLLGEQIARGMVWLLNVLSSTGLGYGLAIIVMTMLVRSLMLPATRMQLANAQKMKDLQPRLKELQTKYAKDREQLQQAQLDLYRKVGFNPLLGCLPILLQMPIFVGLYTALATSVDLRSARFLWIDNLASPDALFQFGFALPLLGWTEFNVLPFITIALFVVQQKLTMPPPVDEEQAMQYKMMNVMMVVMGAMFYRVPAGLCLYFITSSVWGFVERWLLGHQKLAVAPAAPGAVTTPAAGPASRATSAKESDAPAGGLAGWWAKLQEAADKQITADSNRAGGNDLRTADKQRPGSGKRK